MITTTLIGYFDDLCEARLARDELSDSGIDPLSMELASPSAGRKRIEINDRFEDFIARRSAIDHYGDPSERGSAMLTVKVTDDMRIEEITDILEIHGSSDTEELHPVSADTGA